MQTGRDTSTADRAARLPPLPAGFVDRPRLDEALTPLVQGDRRVLAVWAAAGCGKTRLLSHWARQLLDEGHDVLWWTQDDVVQALGRPNLLPDSGFLFLDDVHLLSGLDSGLRREFGDMPDGLRIVMVGRFQPFRSLTFLEATGALVELRTEDLAFTVDEADVLLRGADARLQRSSVNTLHERTGGWAVALALSVPWLRSSEDPDQAVARFHGDSRAVTDYLVTEILEGLDATYDDVLMGAAIREVVPLELAVALTGRQDTGGVLHRLAEHNALITEEPDGFRYHPVLLTFLMAEARRRDPDELRARHAAAARWFLDRGNTLEALEQSIASGDRKLLGALINAQGLEVSLAGNTELVLQALTLMPQKPQPLSSIVLGLLLDAPMFLDRHRTHNLLAQARFATPRTAPWTTALAALQCLAATDADEAFRAAEELSSVDAVSARSRSFGLDLLATLAEAWAKHRGGAADAVVDLIAVAREAASARLGWLYLVAAELVANAAAAARAWDSTMVLERLEGAEAPAFPRNRLGAGMILAASARAYHEALPWSTAGLDAVIAADDAGRGFGASIPARALEALAELDAARNPVGAFEELERLTRDNGQQIPRLVGAGALRMVSIALEVDGRERARQVLASIQAAIGESSLEAELGGYLLTGGSRPSDTAEPRLLAAVEHAPMWHPGAEASAWILLTRAAEANGRATEADARLSRALRHARRHNTYRPFIARHGEGASLVESRLGRLGHLDFFAREVVDRTAAMLPSPEHWTRTYGELTEREHDILRELPRHQSVAEIAQLQMLSVNTIKTHLRHIYLKLGVTDRSEAVTRALEIGLL